MASAWRRLRSTRSRRSPTTSSTRTRGETSKPPFPVGTLPYVRTDSASFLSERQRIVSFSAFQADSASPRFVSAQSASRDPPVILPPLHLASGVELLAGNAKPPVRGRTDSGRCRNDRVAQVLAVDVTLLFSLRDNAIAKEPG